MVAQHGYGPSVTPRIRYAALHQCLQALAVVASERNASVHMPRIGTGHAGGTWDVIRDMIAEALAGKCQGITVYSVPGAQLAKPDQLAMPLLSSAVTSATA